MDFRINGLQKKVDNFSWLESDLDCSTCSLSSPNQSWSLYVEISEVVLIHYELMTLFVFRLSEAISRVQSWCQLTLCHPMRVLQSFWWWSWGWWCVIGWLQWLISDGTICWIPSSPLKPAGNGTLFINIIYYHKLWWPNPILTPVLWGFLF